MKPKSIHFTKMQGAGNDFVVINNREYGFEMNEIIQLAPMVSNRKFGIGADGLLLLDEPVEEHLDYTMIYRNADGSDAGMCGNGARCMALFARRQGYGEFQKFNVHKNEYTARVLSDTEAIIDFPVTSEIEELSLDGHTLLMVNPGTEHVVEEVEEEELQNESVLRETGRILREHPHFQPAGTNVNFICGTGKDKLLLQTYERGVEDLTLACGTGAIASALAWHHRQGPEGNGEESRYHVNVKGGTLTVEFSYNPGDDSYSNIKLKGQAHFVFEGSIDL